MALYKVYLKPGLWKRGKIEYPSHSGIGDKKAIKDAESGRLRGIGEPIAHPMDDEVVRHFINLGVVSGFGDDVPPYWTELQDPGGRFQRQTERLRRRVNLGIATEDERTELERREAKTPAKNSAKKAGAKKSK